MTIKIHLPDHWAEVLRNAPEAGMGYWIATVKTSSGEVFERVVIDSGWVVDVPGYTGIPFGPADVAEIQVTNDKSRYNPHGRGPGV
jgi:hypothetical protein